MKKTNITITLQFLNYVLKILVLFRNLPHIERTYLLFCQYNIFWQLQDLRSRRSLSSLGCQFTFILFLICLTSTLARHSVFMELQSDDPNKGVLKFTCTALIIIGIFSEYLSSFRLDTTNFRPFRRT